MDLSPWQEFGLIGIIMGAVIFMLFKVISWTLATTKDILAQAAKEREASQQAIKLMNDSIVEHNERARSFHEGVCEAHRNQRIEHEKMIENLLHLTVQNKEIVTTLGRINGYKHG